MVAIEPINGVCGIYAIVHKFSAMLYIGSGKDINKRFTQHKSDARRGSTMLVHRAKLARARVGSHHSEETKAKMRASRRKYLDKNKTNFVDSNKN